MEQSELERTRYPPTAQPVSRQELNEISENPRKAQLFMQMIVTFLPFGPTFASVDA